MLVGYMRVSSDSDRQNTNLQRDAFQAADVDVLHLFEDRASGAHSFGERPECDLSVFQRVHDGEQVRQ